MIKLEKATDKDIKFVTLFDLNSLENVYLIKKDDDNVGVIEYKSELKDDYYSVYVEYIEILDRYKKNGYGTKVIDLLSNEGENYICGNSLPNKVSISFWKSLGADFGGEEELLDSYIQRNECIAFSI